jgi:hypothetical protein
VTVEEFAAKVAPRLTARRVQLEPYFEPERVAFFDVAPDRLVAGRKAFDALRAGGFEEAR